MPNASITEPQNIQSWKGPLRIKSPASTQDYTKSQSFDRLHYSNAPWTAAVLCHDHCPGEPVQCLTTHPLTKSLFLTPNLTVPWHSSMLFPWALSPSPESRVQSYPSIPLMRSCRLLWGLSASSAPGWANQETSVTPHTPCSLNPLLSL